MTSSYTKNELFALYQIVGLSSSQRTLKTKLESDLLKYLLNNPSDVHKDQRLEEFVASHQEDTSSTEEETDDSAKSDAVKPTGNESEPIYAESAVEHAEAVIEKKAKAVKFELSPVTRKLRAGWNDFQSGISTVVATNLIILAAEYSSRTYVLWPRDLFLQPAYDEDALITLVTALAYHILLTVVPALIISYVVNFTKKSSIRRKKHAYRFDPVVFGLARLVAAGVVQSTTRTLDLGIISGATSALIGIYASVVQTP